MLVNYIGFVKAEIYLFKRRRSVATEFYPHSSSCDICKPRKSGGLGIPNSKFGKPIPYKQ
jgi:hypothetical protein